MMVNVLFIDFETFLSNDSSIRTSSASALKEVVSKVDDIRIVCLNTKKEADAFCYDKLICSLSQMLNLKKTLFFSFAEVCAWENASQCIAKWMNGMKVRSFAIVQIGSKALIGKDYPNNTICCDAGKFSEAHAKDVLWIMKSMKQKDEDCIWLTSDTHFGHRNIIKYCNRPWNSGKDLNGELIVTDEDVLAMDNELIARWNSVVGKDDLVWHLGDFALGGKEVAERVFPQLNGRINLVMGNHDHWKIKWYYDLGFNRVYDRKVIINDFVVLTHAPLHFLNNNTPFFQCFGHIHDSSVYQTWTKTSCCVCVERHNYTPVSWKMIMQKYKEMNAGDAA